MEKIGLEKEILEILEEEFNSIDEKKLKAIHNKIVNAIKTSPKKEQNFEQLPRMVPAQA